MKKEYLECACVVAAHGVRGLVKAESWCDSPKVLAGLKRVFLANREGEYEEHKLLSASVMGRLVLLSIEGFSDRDKALALKNTVLYAKREDIPLKKGAMFLEDMIGLSVIDARNGRVYGTLKDISDAPRGRIYTVKTANGDVLLPDVREFVKEINADGVFVTPISGFFEDDEI